MILKELSLDYYNLGVGFAGINKLTPAIRALRKASAIDKANFKALNLLGLCLYKRGDFSEAKEIWIQSINVNSGNISPSFKYLESYEETEFTRIIDAFNIALKDAKLGKYNKSIKTLTDKTFPCFDYCIFANLLGLCYLGRRESNNARIAFKRSLQIDSENSFALNYLMSSWDDMDRLKFYFNAIAFIKNLFIRRA